MTTLKEQEAVEYLKRARSCLHQEDDFFHLPMVAKMLEVESAFIYKLQEDDNLRDLARCSIGDHGFPELTGWLSDLKEALKSYRNITLERAKLIQGPLQQWKYASMEGILQEADKIYESFDRDFQLTRSLESLNSEQIEYLFKAVDVSSFPLRTNSEHRGLILAQHKETPFQRVEVGYGDGHRYEELNIMNTIGLKYFDSKTVDRPPFILVAGILGNRVQAYRFLSAKYPLMQRVSRKVVCCSQCSKYGMTRNHEYYDLASIVTPQEKQNEEKCVLGNMDTLDFEKSLNETKASVMKGFTSLDIACFGEVDTGTLLNLMPDFDSMVRDFDSLYEGILNGKAITGEQYRSKNNECVQKYQKLLNSFSDNNLRAAVQLIVGEASDGIGKKIDELTSAKLVPVIKALKTSALPAPHESWIKKFGGFRKKSQN